MSVENTVRRRILEQAQALFFTYGYARVTVDEIATELGMSKKTIYKHFGSKESLLLAVVEALFADIETEIQGLNSHTGLDYNERFKGFVALVGQKLAPIRTPQMNLRRSAPEVWTHVETLRRAVILEPLAGLFDEGFEKGWLRTDFNRELLMLMITTMIEGISNSDAFAQLPLSAADVFQTVVTVMLQGILTDEARQKFNL